jgi:nucleotide-binding universal stress UspA family protein
MVEIKLILCPIDFSEFSIRAYRYALSLAEHYRAKVVVQHVVELWRYPYADFAATAGDYAEFRRVLGEGGLDRLQEFVKKHTHDEIQPELVVQEGIAPDLILSFAETQKTDVIVMGTHGRRGFDRLVLGSVTDRVMRKAHCPVLAVSRPRDDNMAEGKAWGRVHHLGRILYCTDFSENSERALTYAISGAEEYDAELTLLHVLEEVPSLVEAEAAIVKATEQLKKLIPREGRKALKIRTEVRIGKPYLQIIQVALEAQMDMVTMGVSGRGALDRALFGSTTYRVIQLGPCPVLAVHA